MPKGMPLREAIREMEEKGYKDDILKMYFDRDAVNPTAGYGRSHEYIAGYLRERGLDVTHRYVNAAVRQWKKEELEGCECLKEIMLWHDSRGKNHAWISGWLHDQGFEVEKRISGKKLGGYIYDWRIEELEELGLKQDIVKIFKGTKNEEGSLDRAWEYLFSEKGIKHADKGYLRAARKRWLSPPRSKKRSEPAFEYAGSHGTRTKPRNSDT
jgi:hypothetical protein